ncbi:hypothetical protein GCM10010168_51370 [Actinoplanes ianthinogenes]|uniref:DUF8175 domain-containing protein n=1 Tax=Actinoplanes ianthinogenes TaxID=122358 RepID=A0ABM7M3T4_9ACTN|nr:hypothetical protein [Actinoplanes ianthinogenes]BCJ46188.1 hypothetical protein Aiant_68450 [Actinoplanes ianthinogenes]GGR26910.1 hypothetical protein GCM10010168_51370 [Actinoplanes ianthinogenes]
MSEHSDGAQPGPRRWWPIALGAVVVLLVGVGLGNAIRSGDDPAAQPTAPPPAAPGSAAPSTTVEHFAVTAGEGGSSLAADGKTQMGYEHTCAGAVAAATNYISSATRLEWVKSYGDKLLDQISDADSQRIEYYRKGMRTALELKLIMESHPEWGGFRLVSCDSYTATVNVWECEVMRGNGQAQGSCDTNATVVAWVNGDWKLRRYEWTDEPPIPASQDLVGGDTPLDAAQRRQALQAAGPDWQEYANAPQ